MSSIGHNEKLGSIAAGELLHMQAALLTAFVTFKD
jgi:hypothetical protein